MAPASASGAPWVEKYRARDLDSIVGQPVATQITRGIIDRGLPMNVLLAGPAGTGKTTTAKIIIREVLGDLVASASREVNASDQLRMAFVRGELKEFVGQSPLHGGIKVVLLEEADNIPPNAQNALRRLIEKGWRGCRFILTCNYPSNIIDPIRSRCVTVRFAPVSTRAIETVIGRILREEYGASPENLAELAGVLRKATGGDMRLVINTIQACDIERPIESIYEMLGLARPIVLDSIAAMIKARRFAKITRTLNVMGRVNPAHFLAQLGDWGASRRDLGAADLALICQLTADYDRRITTSGDQEEQLTGFIAKLCLAAGGETG
jgi:replication factor C small subunit